jgi:sugar/nucleoside kinase (ribokinase family)
MLSVCDLLLPNAAEALHLTQTKNLDDALTQLTQTVPTVAIKLGVEGGLVRQGEAQVRLRPFPVQVVDTVGAGDSFNAGFLYGTIQQWPPKQCLALALACGSLSTRAAGGTTAQPTLAEAMSQYPD